MPAADYYYPSIFTPLTVRCVSFSSQTQRKRKTSVSIGLQRGSSLVIYLFLMLRRSQHHLLTHLLSEPGTFGIYLLPCYKVKPSQMTESRTGRRKPIPQLPRICWSSINQISNQSHQISPYSTTTSGGHDRNPNLLIGSILPELPVTSRKFQPCGKSIPNMQSA